MKTPRVSVILPVYNGAGFLAESLGSVLNQTFGDFEVLVIDDASTDDSAAVAESFGDPRVCLVRHEQNLRLPATLNHGLDLAQGEFVARMDADDICDTRRFAQQVAFLDAFPEVGICGSAVRLFGTGDCLVRKYPVSPGAVEAFRFFNCPFAHPTVMLRRRVVEEHHLRYDPRSIAVEDFDLWTRLLKFTRGANLPDQLLHYRLHESSVTSRDWALMNDNSTNVLQEALREIIPDVTDDQARFHRQIGMAEITPNIVTLRDADAWLERIALALDRGPDARAVLREVWFRLAMRVVPETGLTALKAVFGSRFTRKYGLDPAQKMLIFGSAAKAWARGRR